MAQSAAPFVVHPRKVGAGDTHYTSWFFDKYGMQAQLPTPNEIVQIATSNSTQNSTRSNSFDRPPPVRFSTTGILVKWGHYITSAEAMCLQTLKSAFGSHVPVPELYGWHVQPEDPERGLPSLVFIYMEEVKGVTLKDRYAGLDQTEVIKLARQLAEMVASFRTIRPGTSEPYIGMSPCPSPGHIEM
jgi:hypothetical protein